MTEVKRVSALFLLFAVIWSANLARWDLWGPDEPRYAQVAREMVRSGNYLVPHLNGQVYGEKPPMFFWSIAALSVLLDRDGRGPSPLTARLPSAIAGLGTLLFTYFIARRLYGSPVALLSALMLFSAIQFTSSATDAHLDSSLVFWTTAAMFFFHKGYVTPSGDRRWFLLAYVAMAFGVLTKGPVAFVVPLLSGALFLIVKRDVAVLRRVEAIKGFVLMAGIIMLWLVPAGISGGREYFDYMVFRQSSGRALHAFAHAQPFYYYIDVFLADFLPWSLFLPFAGIYFAGRKEARKEILFPFAWFAATFVFFSLMSGKRSLYLLPLYPPAVLMMAKFCADQIDEVKGKVGRRPLLLLLPCYLFFGSLFACGAATALLAAGLVESRHILTSLPPWFGYSVILLGLAGLCGIILLVKRIPLKVPFRLVIVSAIAIIVIALFLPYPPPNPDYSLRPFAQRIERHLGPEHSLKTTFGPELFNYFLDRVPIESIPEGRLAEEINATPGLLVLHKTRRSRAGEGQSGWIANSGMKIIESATVGSATYYLLARDSEQHLGKPSL